MSSGEDKRLQGEDARAAAEAAWLSRLDASIAGDAGKQFAKHAGSDRGAPPVVLLEGSHPALLAPDALLRLLTKTNAKSGGPGGQNRNKVQTMVVLTHNATGLTARAGERRSIAENMPAAMRRMRLNLAVVVRCAVAAGEARTAMWRERCSESGKHAGLIRVSPAHEDFPAMLATSLDVLWASELDQKLCATRLACTPTQLVKLWAEHMPALLWVNGQRAARGMRELKV